MNDYWDKEPWCCLKHFLKGEVNGKETLEKAIRDGGKFDPEGGELRNFLTSVENVEAAVGHFDEFTVTHIYKALMNGGDESEDHMEKAKFYRDMADSTRYVRQKLINSVGEDKSELMICIYQIGQLIDKLTGFMKGENKDGLLRVEELE